MAGGGVKGWVMAGAAGTCAALAAAMAKIASPQLAWEWRMLCFAAVVALNAMMWTCYVSSITILSSVQATVVNFGANFLLSGLVGFLVFGEAASKQWFVGASLIVLGILALSRGSKIADDKPSKIKPL